MSIITKIRNARHLPKVVSTSRLFSFVLSLFSFFAVIYILVDKMNNKVAYIRSSELIMGYDGMKEAQMKYKSKMEGWQTSLDSIKSLYQTDIMQFQNESSHLSSEQKKTKENRLNKIQAEIEHYSSQIENMAKEEEKKMTEAVLMQINEQVKKYGEANGYKVILGTTADGSVIYGNEAIDITNDLLTEINKDYRGK